MARKIGLFLPIIMDENRPVESFSALRSVSGKSTVLLFNPYSNNAKRGNYFDLYLNLIHEKHHADTPEDSHDKIDSEFFAYEEVIIHHYFN